MEKSVDANKRKSVRKRKLAMFSRWLHIYGSMISFAIVLFFSVTGLTLNHPDSFGGGPVTKQDKGKLTVSWVNTKDTAAIAKLPVVEYFRNKHAVKGAVTDFRIDDAQCSVSFKGPAYQADVFINRSTGEYDLTQTSTGLVGFINDLHKGRDTGKVWSWVIDISAILMVLISASGLILLLYIKKKRMNGMILLVVGLVIVYLVYRIWGQ